MFDDLNQKNNLPDNDKKESNKNSKEGNNSFSSVGRQTIMPNNQSTSPEKKDKVDDIFSETDKAQPFKEVKREVNPLSASELEADEKKDKLTKILVLSGFIVGLIIILSASYWLIGKLFDNSKLETTNINTKNIIFDDNENKDSGQAGSENSEQGDSASSSDTPFDPAHDGQDKGLGQDAIIDSDNDGLSDEEELKLGLDINNVDTDNDGLFDREEVMVYLTDPLDSDTDKDGFLDGAEVRDGYNPKGSGKLYDINN